MPVIRAHSDLAPARPKDPLTGFYPSGMLDSYAKKGIAKELNAAREHQMICPHCGRPIALELRRAKAS